MSTKVGYANGTPWFPSQPAFTPKPFASSFEGTLYEMDPENWELWLKTGELKYLRPVPPNTSSPAERIARESSRSVGAADCKEGAA